MLVCARSLSRCVISNRVACTEVLFVLRGFIPRHVAFISTTLFYVIPISCFPDFMLLFVIFCFDVFQVMRDAPWAPKVRRSAFAAPQEVRD